MKFVSPARMANVNARFFSVGDDHGSLLTANTLCLCIETAVPTTLPGISAARAAATPLLCLLRGAAACPPKCFILWPLLLRREI